MKTTLRRLLLWILSTGPVQYCMKWFIPAIRFGGKRLSDEQVSLIKTKLQVGDTILVKDPLKLSHILIGGQWSHAAICVEFLPNVGHICAEMGHSDYQEVNLKKCLGYAQSVCIIRPVQDDPNYGLKMAHRAHILGLASNSYDFTFSDGEKSLYCSELCWLADYERHYKADLSDLAGLGHMYISPDGLYKARGAAVILEI